MEKEVIVLSLKADRVVVDESLNSFNSFAQRPVCISNCCDKESAATPAMWGGVGDVDKELINIKKWTRYTRVHPEYQHLVENIKSGMENGLCKVSSRDELFPEGLSQLITEEIFLGVTPEMEEVLGNMFGNQNEIRRLKASKARVENDLSRMTSTVQKFETSSLFRRLILAIRGKL